MTAFDKLSCFPDYLVFPTRRHKMHKNVMRAVFGIFACAVVIAILGIIAESQKLTTMSFKVAIMFFLIGYLALLVEMTIIVEQLVKRKKQRRGK